MLGAVTWISLIIVQVIEVGGDGKTICYKCYGSGKDKPDCGTTCETSSEGGSCRVFTDDGLVFQDCYSGDSAIQECRDFNTGLIGLSKLTPSTKKLCYMCNENMCNAFDKMPRDDLSAYDPFLPEMPQDDKVECYTCDSRNLNDCNKKKDDCKPDTVTCYRLFKDGIYKQGCRNKDFLDDFECEKIQNSTNTTKEFCEICSTTEYILCNYIVQPEETETTTKKRPPQMSIAEDYIPGKNIPENGNAEDYIPGKNIPENGNAEKNIFKENNIDRKVTENPSPPKNSATRNSVPTFFSCVLWSLTYLLLILLW